MVAANPVLAHSLSDNLIMVDASRLVTLVKIGSIPIASQVEVDKYPVSTNLDHLASWGNGQPFPLLKGHYWFDSSWSHSSPLKTEEVF